MKYIIMCGGSYQFPRHFTQIRGETVVARTIRLLRAEGVEDLAISATDPCFSAFGLPVLKHQNDFKVESGVVVAGSWVNGFYPTLEPACYIFGDVVFSPEAIRTIVETPEVGIRFFGSAPPFSHLYTKPWAEPFAFKVDDQRRFRAAVDFVNANLETGIFHRHPIAWELWQVIIGHDVNRIDYDTITQINDYTCDIDSPADAPRIEEMICRS